MDFLDMPDAPEDDNQTRVPDSHQKENWYQSDTSGKDVDPARLKIAKEMLGHMTPEQKKEIDTPLNSEGVTLGHSRTFIHKLGAAGKVLRTQAGEQLKSPAEKFYGGSMDDAWSKSFTADVQSMISKAIQDAKDEIIRRSGKPIKGTFTKPSK